MPIAAKCPTCGASLSETSVLALAPVCEHCHTVIMEIGGTLGLTSAYGLNDPTITRTRVEADLAVFCDYRRKYVGMLAACKEQLNWGVERYAKLPNNPELLSLVPVPPFWQSLGGGLVLGIKNGFFIFLGGMVIMIPILCIVDVKHPPLWAEILSGVYWLLIFLGLVVPLANQLFPYIMAVRANGKRPLENERRQTAYEEARAAALQAAEPIKAAQDHRLSVQIRELDGLIATVTEKAEDVRKILRTL